MDTRDYRTRTIFREQNNAAAGGNVWPIGLDIGYSAVKVFARNTIACFPSYAEESHTDLTINLSGEDDTPSITYKGEDGVKWTVGAAAQDMIRGTDTNAGSLSIYDRERYASPMFKVITRVGLAAALRANQYGDPSGKEIVVQTGLPPKYMDTDQRKLKRVIAGHHTFSVKFGNEPERTYDFNIKEENVFIMDQPMGSLISVATGKDFKPTKDAASFFRSRVLLMDAGFGTLDCYPVLRSNISRDNCRTYSDLGMKQVLKETRDRILEEYGTEISVPAFQQYLETGEVRVRDKDDEYRYSKVKFDPILEKASQDVCDKALKQLMIDYPDMIDYDILIITGGTGAAWNGYIRNSKYFKYADTLKLVSGNAGDPDLQYLFSNVRGYYIYRCTQLYQRKKS